MNKNDELIGLFERLIKIETYEKVNSLDFTRIDRFKGKYDGNSKVKNETLEDEVVNRCWIIINNLGL